MDIAKNHQRLLADSAILRQLPVHYGHIGPLEDLRERLREATVCADAYSKA